MSEYTLNNKDYYADIYRENISILITDDAGNKFSSPTMVSPNFDGYIPIATASVAVRDVQPGYYIEVESIEGIKEFYPVMYVFRSETLLGEPDQCDIKYLYNKSLETITYAPTTTSVVVRYEDWNSKAIGSSGWTISPQGNAIFTNIAARGRIEALSGYIGNSINGWEIGANLLSNASVGFYAPSAITGQVAIFAGAPFASRASAAFRVGYDGSLNASSATITGNLTATTLDVGGPNGIVYNGSTVTIGSSVTINAPVTVNSLQVGASPTLLKIADDVNGSNDGIYINANNYWYSDGQFSVGGSANNAVWSGTTLTITGTINATNITSSVGNIAGFELAKSQLSTASIIVSSSGGFRLGSPTVFSVDQFGNLVATSASITGNITAQSGQFTGSISAQHITASIGSIAGFTLANNQMSTASVVVSSSGGLRLGSPAIFSVDQFGNLVATSASITGNITANSGQFTGSISAQHITASTGNIAGFALANNQMSTASIVVSSSGGFRLGNPTIFSVDQYGNLVAQNASVTGRINATSGSFSGDITAAAGRFTGSVVIDTNGLLYVGDLASQRVVMTSSGIFAYHQNGLEAFALPISGSPRIGAFKIVPTGIVSQSASNANMILGNVDGSGSALSGIVLRGYRSAGASVAIYSIQNGVPTTYDSGDGFYVDENARLKLKGATGSLRFDGDDLYISGNINARSGQFTGSVSAQYITASNGNIGGWNLSASTLTGNSASIDAQGSIKLGSGQNIVALSSTDSNRIWAGSAVSTTAPFRVSSTGFLTATGASIVGNINAQSGSFTGTLAVIGAGANIYAGTSNTSGARVLITPEGIKGISSVESNSFYLSSGTTSLLLDGGFEGQTPNVTITSPWSKFWGNSGSAIGSDTHFYSGSESAMVGSSATFIQALNQTFTQVANQMYSVNAWVLSSASLNGSDALVEIWVLESSTNPSPTYFQANTTIKAVTPALSTSSGVWTRISGTYVSTAPSATISLRTYSSRSTPLRVWWDAVEVSVGASMSSIGGLDFNESAMYSDKINIDSRGFATFGSPELSTTASAATSSVTGAGVTVNAANFVTISGIDPTYRIWVGDSDPSKAYFSVRKDGSIILNSGGDMSLFSASTASIGTSGSIISKINFFTQGNSFAAGRIDYFPSSSAMRIGAYGNAGIGRVLIDTFVTTSGTGSVELNGTIYGNNRAQFGGNIGVTGATPLAGVGINQTDSAAANATLQSTQSNVSYTGTMVALRTNRTTSSAFDFIICSASIGGTADTKIRMTGDGRLRSDLASVTPADYAEMFEWYDGNPNAEDRSGLTVVLNGNKIDIATESSELIIGVVSTQPAIIADTAWSHWNNKYLSNDLGQRLYEEYEWVEWDEEVLSSDGVVTSTKTVSYVVGDVPEGVQVPASARTGTDLMPKLNPDYDPTVEYIPREERKEWSAIGMVGKLRMIKGCPTNPRWIKMRDISETVEEWLVR